MELQENTILLIQEAIDSYIIKLTKELEELETTEPANRDKIISQKCNIKALKDTANYLEDKKRASKDSKVKAQQLREAVEELVNLSNNGYYEELELINIESELQSIALYIIKNKGLIIPPLQ